MGVSLMKKVLFTSLMSVYFLSMYCQDEYDLRTKIKELDQQACVENFIGKGSFPHNSSNNDIESNKYRIFKNSVKVANGMGTAASIGCAGLSICIGRGAEILAIPWVAEAVIHVLSAKNNPEQNPKKAIALGATNIIFGGANSLVAFLVGSAGGNYIPTLYFCVKGVTTLITAGYQIFVGRKTLKNR